MPEVEPAEPVDDWQRSSSDVDSYDYEAATADDWNSSRPLDEVRREILFLYGLIFRCGWAPELRLRRWQVWNPKPSLVERVAHPQAPRTDQPDHLRLENASRISDEEGFVEDAREEWHPGFPVILPFNLFSRARELPEDDAADVAWQTKVPVRDGWCR